MLRFHLLGQPEIQTGEESLSGFISAKARALLIYLVMSPGRQSRAALANLFWSEFTDEQARNNLRTTLSNLNGLVSNYLTISRDTVTFNRRLPYWLDVEIVRQDFEKETEGKDLARLGATAALYRGGLLDGFHVRNAPTFEDWLLLQREQLHIIALRGLSALADRCIAEGAYEIGLTSTRQLLALEPWLEQSHRQQMVLLASNGQRSAALSQYETCRSTLAAEFGVEPLAETNALYEQIKGGVFAPSAPTQTQLRNWAGRLNGAAKSLLSIAPSPSQQAFIDWASIPTAPHLLGREEESKQLTQWLVEDRARLISVYGLGGQGKSALIAHVVRSLIGVSPLTNSPVQKEKKKSENIKNAEFQAVLWRSLRGAPSLDELLRSWILSLSQNEPAPPSSTDQLITTLIDYLRQWRCLLILDNVGGILQGGGHAGHIAEERKNYEEFFKRIANSNHQSCLLLISRELPVAVEGLTNASESSTRKLLLGPLSNQTSQAWLADKGVEGEQAVLEGIAERFSGNPLALSDVENAIQTLFFGDGEAFLDSEIPAFGAIREILDEQFARLGSVEQEMLTVLANAHQPFHWSDLRAALSSNASPREITEAQLSLVRRGLILQEATGIRLSNLVLGYVLDRA